MKHVLITSYKIIFFLIKLVYFDWLSLKKNILVILSHGNAVICVVANYWLIEQITWKNVWPHWSS